MFCEEASLSLIKRQLKKVLKMAGYRVSTWGYSNRFEAMEECVIALARNGYIPSAIIDGGANRGDWAKMARAIYPNSHIHLVEPLPKCVELLNELAARDGQMTVHPYAATVPGVEQVRFNLVGEDGISTSAQVANPGEQLPDETVLQASTLDDMFDNIIRPGALLKLDLQGHEIKAMEGGLRTLENVEVMICEVSFYPVNDNGRPVFIDVIEFISKHGFVFYDIASLSSRYNDHRLQWGDVVVVRSDSRLLANNAWRTA
jgi:FkbM family methyltransferase